MEVSVADFFEVDFLDVETSKSGDAITVRYEIGGVQKVHVIDAGYQATGPGLVKHIRDYYGGDRVDHLVVTHCDGDHTGGVLHVLENLQVESLWMLRPWLYADELLHRFTTQTTEGLRRRLRSIYSSLVEIEKKAIELGIPINDPFQGVKIGEFTVLAPSRDRYLELIVASDKTPETVEESEATVADRAYWIFAEAMKKAINFIASAWNEEVFSTEDTSAENEMSVVQAATLCNKKIVLTGDAGREALAEAANYAPFAGLILPGVDRIQIPHHGSRRNVSTELLDQWLGGRLPQKVASGQEAFTAIVSSAKADTKHPRKAVVRAFIHRGAKVIATESRSIQTSGGAVPARDGWTAVEGETYPDSQEE